jgi:hypothetical protein
MTTKEIDGVVRALTTVAENLETDSARQSMQEAFLQVRAYASAPRPEYGLPSLYTHEGET